MSLNLQPEEILDLSTNQIRYYQILQKLLDLTKIQKNFLNLILSPLKIRKCD